MSDTPNISNLAREGMFEDDPLAGLPPEQRAALEAKMRASESALKSEVSALKSHGRALEKEIAHRDKIIAAQHFYDDIPRTLEPIKAGKKDKHPSGIASAVFVLSDWHIEEVVDPKAVGGNNAYSLDIAKARADQVAKSIVWLLKAKRHDAKIDDIVMALLGDFITGMVPTGDPSLLREVGPTRAAEYAHEMLADVLRYVAKHAGARRIVVPCIGGNHGRLTRKPADSRGAQWNLESYMLGNLAREFKGEGQFEFIGTDDYCIMLDVQGLRVRFQHGDGIRFGGGVGGMAIPINKARMRMNETPDEHAGLDVMGHFHQAYDGGTFVVNGSLIGITGYARKGRFAYQAPEQVGFLVRPQTPNASKGARGKCDTFRVFVD